MINANRNSAVGYRRRGGIIPPDILDDGNTVAWFDGAAEYMTKDGSNLVSAWNDRSGNSNNLLQAGADAIKPVWSANSVLFDGTDNFMKTASFTLNRPEMLYIVLKQVTWSANDDLWDGDAVNSMMARQITGTPGIGLYNGSFSVANNNLEVGVFGIIRAYYDAGANSSLQINETTKWVGDIGVVQNAAGFTLGSQADGTALWSNIQVKEIILRKIEDAVPNEQLIYNYLASKYCI